MSSEEPDQSKSESRTGCRCAPQFPGVSSKTPGHSAPHDPAHLARAMRVLGLANMPSLDARLGQLTVPIQLIAGAKDEKFHRIAQRMHEQCSASTLTVIPECGHNPLLEAPQELATALEQ